MKSIGERIKDARKSAGLTQLELAKKTELSRYCQTHRNAL